MSIKANLEPFRLTPEGMYTIMGGLKIGGYRSAMQYLDLAKQEHIRLGHCWTEQHALAYKVCARSCKRGLGSAKQAAALPLGRLHEVSDERVSVPSVPSKPVISTIVASWWLLRELEASRARVRHITIQADTRTVSWLLPSSKTDIAALGTTRRHSCSCSVLPAGLCPYHLVVELIRDKGPADPVFADARGLPPAKAGWQGQTRFNSWPFCSIFLHVGQMAPEPTPATRRGQRVHSIWQPAASSCGASRSSVDGARMPSFGISAKRLLSS